jgi:citrate lyase subunit beta/citryl-CoA lyase
MGLNQPLRSILFVPGNKAHMLEKARTLPADAVILDLEDGVPVDEKETARATIREALESGDYQPQVILRVNSLATSLVEEDLRQAFGPGVAAVCLPKANTVADVLHLAPMLTEAEHTHGLEIGSLDMLLMIETSHGVLHAHEMAERCWRIRALCLGGEDLTRDLGAVRTRESKEVAQARAQVVLAARASGAMAIDTIWTDLNDRDGLVAEARQARELGYSGKLLIHPDQIEPVHRAFAPTLAEVEHAQHVVEAFDAASARGDGVIALDGQMLDAPVVARAREILKMAEA